MKAGMCVVGIENEAGVRSAGKDSAHNLFRRLLRTSWYECSRFVASAALIKLVRSSTSSASAGRGLMDAIFGKKGRRGGEKAADEYEHSLSSKGSK